MKRAVSSSARISKYVQQPWIMEIGCAFAVPIKVAAWLANDEPPWDFDIVEDEPLAEDGVEIAVNSLTVAPNVHSKACIRAKPSADHRAGLHAAPESRAEDLAKRRGYSGALIELRQSDEFAPMREEHQDELDGQKVLSNLLWAWPRRRQIIRTPTNKTMAKSGPVGMWPATDGSSSLRIRQFCRVGNSDGWPLWHRSTLDFSGLSYSRPRMLLLFP